MGRVIPHLKFITHSHNREFNFYDISRSEVELYQGQVSAYDSPSWLIKVRGKVYKLGLLEYRTDNDFARKSSKKSEEQIANLKSLLDPKPVTKDKS